MPAPKKSARPKERPSKERMDKMIGKAQEKKDVEALARSVKYQAKGGKVKKMREGGMCRGMGAATRGGKYRMG